MHLLTFSLHTRTHIHKYKSKHTHKHTQTYTQSFQKDQNIFRKTEKFRLIFGNIWFQTFFLYTDKRKVKNPPEVKNSSPPSPLQYNKRKFLIYFVLKGTKQSILLFILIGRFNVQYFTHPPIYHKRLF